MWWSVRTAAPSRNLLPVRLTTLTDATTLDDSGLSTPQVESTDGFMVSKALVGDDKIEALRGQTVLVKGEAKRMGHHRPSCRNRHPQSRRHLANDPHARH